MKFKKLITIGIFLLVFFCVKGNITYAGTLPKSFPSDENYYYWEGCFYWFGKDKNNYEMGDSWYAPKPQKPNTMYNNKWNDIQIDGYYENNGNRTFGFRTYDAKWADGKNKKPEWNHMYKRYEKKVRAYYKRKKTKPSFYDSYIKNAIYVRGNDYWTKPGHAVNIKIEGKQKFPGTAKMELDDYVKENFIQLKGDGYDIRAKNYRYDKSVNVYKNNASANIEFSSKDYHEMVGDTNQRFESVFNVTINNEATLNVLGSHTSFNGLDTDWTDTGKRLRVDGTAPFGNNIRIANRDSNGYDVYIDNVTDNGSGVKKVLFKTWTNNSNVKYLEGSNVYGNTWKVRVNKSDFQNNMDGYTTQAITYDMVDNSQERGTVNLNLAKADLIVESVKIYDNRGNELYNLVQSDSYKAKITVKNIGEITSNNCKVSFGDINGSNTKNLDIQSLEANKSKVIETDFNVSILGNKIYRAIVDSNSQVAEENENNNSLDVGFCVYPKNTKPIADFSITNSIEDRDRTIKYTDSSYDPNEWDEIIEKEWSYRRTKDKYGKDSFSDWIYSKPTSLTEYGTYEVRLRVKDKGNVASPSQWSEYCVKTLIIKNKITVNAEINPNPSKQGQEVKFRINTTYSPNVIIISIPNEMSALGGVKEIRYTIPQQDEEYLSGKEYFVPLDIPLTIDDNSNRIKDGYKFRVRALRECDGEYADTDITLDIKGNIYDDIRTRYR